MYRHILVAVAFDQDHKPGKSLVAARLLADGDARVTLVHVMAEVPGYALSYMPEGYEEELQRAALAELAALSQDLPNSAAVLLHGHAGNQILEWAAQNEVDCIVLDSHRPGLRDYLLGSTAARIVRHAPCTVMVLR
jgi:nucleotide-binding universal stress UspA family protein